MEHKCNQKAFAGVWMFCGTSRLSQPSQLLRHVECLGASVAFVGIEPLLWSKHELICGSYRNRTGGGCTVTLIKAPFTLLIHVLSSGQITARQAHVDPASQKTNT